MPKKGLPKKKGRKKLSLYNRTTRYYWKVVNEYRSKGNQLSYQDARIKLKKLYSEVKAIKEETGKSPFIGSKKRDFNFIKRLFKVTKIQPPDYPKEELLPLPDAEDNKSEWYLFPREMTLLNETTNQYDNIAFDFDLEDTGSVDGQSFSISEIDGRKIRIGDIITLLYHTAIWWYLREHNNGEYNSSPVPKYYIKERRGNEYVKYGLTGFTAGDGTIKPTPIKPIEEKKEETKEEKKISDSNSNIEIEREKTKQLEVERDLIKQQNRQKEIDYKKEIIQMFKDKLISKDEMMQLLDSI